MSASYDILVESPLRRPVLVVECRRIAEAPPEYAGDLRQRLLEHEVLWIPPDAFFMIIDPAMLYLWDPDRGADQRADYAVPSMPVLRPYLGKRADQPQKLHEGSLEIVVSSWLDALAGGLRKPDPTLEADRVLINSGLFKLMKGGVVRTGSQP